VYCRARKGFKNTDLTIRFTGLMSGNNSSSFGFRNFFPFSFWFQWYFGWGSSRRVKIFHFYSLGSNREKKAKCCLLPHHHCILFLISLIEKNVQSGFVGAGLILHDPQKILLKLDVQLQILTLTRPLSTLFDLWILKTPQNLINVNLQTEFIKK
jgi:hypothetical protein